MMHFRYLIFFVSYCFFQTALAQNYAQCQNLKGQSYSYCMDAVSKGLSPLAPPTSAGNPAPRVSPPSVVTAPTQPPRQQAPVVNPPVQHQPPFVQPPRVNAPVVNYGQPPVVALPSSNSYKTPTAAAPFNNQGVVRPPQVSAPVQQYNCQTSNGTFRITGAPEYAQAKCNELNAKPAQSSQSIERVFTCGNTSKQVRAASSEAAYVLCNPSIPPTVNAPTQNTQISFRCFGSAADKTVQAESAEKATALCSQLASQSQPAVAPPQVNSPYVPSGQTTSAPPTLNAPQQFTCQTATALRPFSATNGAEARAKCDALVLQDAKPVVVPPTNQPVVSTPTTAPRVELPNSGVATNSVPSISKPYVVPIPSQTTSAPPEERLTQQRFDCPVKGGIFVVLAINEEGARARCNVLRVEHGQPAPSQTTNQHNSSPTQSPSPQPSNSSSVNFIYNCASYPSRTALGRDFSEDEKRFIRNCAVGIGINTSNKLDWKELSKEIASEICNEYCPVWSNLKDYQSVSDPTDFMFAVAALIPGEKLTLDAGKFYLKEAKRLLQEGSIDAARIAASKAKNELKNILKEKTNLSAGINLSDTAILKNGYYEVKGYRYSKYYYEKLWVTGRGGSTHVMDYLLSITPKSVVAHEKSGFYFYIYDKWELVYNPVTKEVWHLLPI